MERRIQRKHRNTLNGMKAPAIKKAIDILRFPSEPGIKLDAPVDEKNEFGCTRLIYRARDGDVENMRKLIDAGADLDTRTNEGMSALHWAAKGGHLSAVKLLVEKGADVDILTKTGESPLTQTVFSNRKNCIEIAKILTENGADVNGRGIGDYTPLFWAAMNGNAGMARFLMDRGAEFVTTKNKETPLDRAADNAHADVLDLFLYRGNFSRDEIVHAYDLVKSSGRDTAWKAMAVIEKYL